MDETQKQKPEIECRFTSVVERLSHDMLFREFLFEDILFGTVQSLDGINYNYYLDLIKREAASKVHNPDRLRIDMREKVEEYKKTYPSIDAMREEYIVDLLCGLFNPFVTFKEDYGDDYFPLDYPEPIKRFIQQTARCLKTVLAVDVLEVGLETTGPEASPKDVECLMNSISKTNADIANIELQLNVIGLLHFKQDAYNVWLAAKRIHYSVQTGA